MDCVCVGGAYSELVERHVMKRGFTLMELLVVIAIIGILIAIAVASYSTAQKKSRDSRRIGDMKQLQNAWEQYYADNGSTYPSDATCAYSVTPTPGVMSGTYMPGGFPVDPKSGTPYPQMGYTGWSKCTVSSYCFCAGLEYSSSANTTTDCGGNGNPVGYNGLFCINQLQ